MSNYKKYSFLMVYIIIFLPCTGFYLGGIYNFITFIILFSLIPLIDYFIQDKSNPDNIQSKELLKDKYYVLITLLYIPVQMILLGYSVYLVHRAVAEYDCKLMGHLMVEEYCTLLAENATARPLCHPENMKQNRE